MSKLMEFIDNIGDKWGTSGFAKDAKAIHTHLGLDLTRDEYNNYHSKNQKLGFSKDLIEYYYNPETIAFKMLLKLNDLDVITRENFSDKINQMDQNKKHLLETKNYDHLAHIRGEPETWGDKTVLKSYMTNITNYVTNRANKVMKSKP